MRTLSYEELADKIKKIEYCIQNSETRNHGPWTGRLAELKAEKDSRDRLQAEGIKFLRKEAEMALSDDCPVTAANYPRYADCLESLWNTYNQKRFESEGW